MNASGQEREIKPQRRTLLKAGLMGLGWTAMRGLAAASNSPTRFVFHVSSTPFGLLDWLRDRGYAHVTAELEKRGFPSMLVHSSVRGSDTPNGDRASAVVKALQNVTDDVVIVGISNEGNFLPLVAAARPIRRVVYVNACIPRPGKPFIEVCQTEQIAVPGSYLDKLLKASQSITDDFLKLINDPNATKAQLKAMLRSVSITEPTSAREPTGQPSTSVDAWHTVACPHPEGPKFEASDAKYYEIGRHGLDGEIALKLVR
jgi:hypothetical protein